MASKVVLGIVGIVILGVVAVVGIQIGIITFGGGYSGYDGVSDTYLMRKYQNRSL